VSDPAPHRKPPSGAGPAIITPTVPIGRSRTVRPRRHRHAPTRLVAGDATRRGSSPPTPHRKTRPTPRLPASTTGEPAARAFGHRRRQPAAGRGGSTAARRRGANGNKNIWRGHALWLGSLPTHRSRSAHARTCTCPPSHKQIWPLLQKKKKERKKED
jgi:hypothetical protein